MSVSQADSGPRIVQQLKLYHPTKCHAKTRGKMDKKYHDSTRFLFEVMEQGSYVCGHVAGAPNPQITQQTAPS